MVALKGPTAMSTMSTMASRCGAARASGKGEEGPSRCLKGWLAPVCSPAANASPAISFAGRLVVGADAQWPVGGHWPLALASTIGTVVGPDGKKGGLAGGLGDTRTDWV